MREHQLKIWPGFFAAVRSGIKTWDVRRNDRDFQVGDIVVLCEWVPGDGYTGEHAIRRVTYVQELTGIGIPGFVGLTLGDA